MLEPKKTGEGGLDPTDPAQQNDSTKQVDSQDMNKEEGDGGTEPQPPAA
jgi:hypothetical protein